MPRFFIKDWPDWSPKDQLRFHVKMLVLSVLLLLLALVFRGFLVPESRAVQAMEAKHYRNVVVTKRDWFFVDYRGCRAFQAARFSVRATKPDGTTVNAQVCSGWLIGGTFIYQQL